MRWEMTRVVTPPERVIARAVHQGVELRASLLAPRHRHIEVFPNDVQSSALGVGAQIIELQIGILIGCGHAQVDGGAVI